MTTMLKTSPPRASWRRSPPLPAASCCGFPSRFGGRGRSAVTAVPPRDQRLGGDPARRHGGDPHRPLRDGPGHADRPRPARRRGTGVRLAQGHRPNIRRPARTWRATASGELLDRRQPRHPRVAGLCPQGRRHRARDADPGGRRRLEGAGAECTRRQGRHHAQPRPAARRPTARSPRPRPSSSRRTRSSSRTRRTGRSPASRWRGSTRADKVTGKQIYGIDLKLPGMLNAAITRLPGVRRQAQELRRRRGREHARREEGRGGRRQRRRGGGRHLVAAPRRRSTPCRSSGTTARTRGLERAPSRRC